MKILIAGGGKVGSSLIRQLTTEGHEITLIDRSAGVLEEIMEQYDIIAVQGNSATMSVLEEAGVADANLLIAATDADEVNLLCCMTAHVMNPDVHTIARIRNPEYRDQSYLMRDRFALNMIINPEEEAAKEIARLLQLPGFMKIDMFARGPACGHTPSAGSSAVHVLRIVSYSFCQHFSQVLQKRCIPIRDLQTA